MRGGSEPAPGRSRVRLKWGRPAPARCAESRPRRTGCRSRVLDEWQGEALRLNLRDNHGDIGKVQAFLNQVRAYLGAGILNQVQADSLVEPGNILYLSVSRR
jgi:hypothetical protein